jgi:ubiquitin C-terminal hydrolase
MKKFLGQHLVPLISTIKKPKNWNYQPATAHEGAQKYVGLRNLGCICYMNSMMQQFFMTPAFRYNLLCVDDGKEENL